MIDQVWRGKIGEIAHRRQRAIDRFALQNPCRARLAIHRFRPRRCPSIERENFRGLICEQRGYRRIECVACPLTHDSYGKLFASQHALEGGVPSDVNDSHRQGDLITPR